MSMNDLLAAALSKILNAEKIGRSECLIKPASIMVKRVLEVMKDHGYIGSIREIKDNRGNVLKVSLIGNINKCGVIKPNYPVKAKDYEKFEQRYLPAKDFGIIIVSTNKGIMTHNESKEKKIGGKLIAYCY